MRVASDSAESQNPMSQAGVRQRRVAEPHIPSDTTAENATHRRWAAEHPRRALAAAAAVGTIDQALLSGLPVRHAHLRGAALLRV